MRTFVLQIRLTEAERITLQAEAGTKKLSKYAREKLFVLQSKPNVIQTPKNVIQIKGLTRGGQPVVLQSPIEDDPPEDKTIRYITDIECMKCGNDNARKRKDRGNLCDACFNG